MTAYRCLPLVGALIVVSSVHPVAEQQAGSLPQPGPSVGVVARTSTTRLVASTPTSLVGTIQGSALTSTNGHLANAIVRLRDARFGKILGNQVTDKLGLFEFDGLEPGTYIVEMMGQDQSVLASSQLLSVNAGEAVSAVVKLPFRVPPYSSVLSSSKAALFALATQAATSAILAVAPVGDATCDLGQGSR